MKCLVSASPDRPAVLRELEPLCESAGACLAEARLDRERGLVCDVALLGPESRNGYRYTAEAMRQAVPLYDGRPVFIDHPESAQPTQRKLRDYAGHVVSPRYENDRVRGDLRLVGPNAGWLLSLIEAAPRDIGMSHIVLARRNPAGDCVERIERVVSVDIVAFPATTQTFAEGVSADWRALGANSSHAAVAAERDRTNPSINREWQEAVQQLVERSRIPSLGRMAALSQLLQTCPDPRVVLAVLEACWRQATAEAPRSREKSAPDSPDGQPSPHVRRALIAAIRGA
jgi:hypothetical protein